MDLVLYPLLPLEEIPPHQLSCSLCREAARPRTLKAGRTPFTLAWLGFLLLMTKHHGQKQLGEERVYFVYTSSSGADAKAMRSAAYWLAFHDLLSLLSGSTQDHQSKGGSTFMTWAIPHQSLTTNIPPKLAYSPILRKQFLN